MIFSGFEIGAKIKTGLPLIHNGTIHNSPVKDAFRIALSKSPRDSSTGHMSFDQTAVLVAVRGYKPYFTLHPGKLLMNVDGSNAWEEGNKGQFYLIQKEDPLKMQELINHLMMKQPKNK